MISYTVLNPELSLGAHRAPKTLTITPLQMKCETWFRDGNKKLYISSIAKPDDNILKNMSSIYIVCVSRNNIYSFKNEHVLRRFGNKLSIEDKKKVKILH